LLTAWRRANALDKALEAYRLHGDWRSALGLAFQAKKSTEFVSELTKQLASHLTALYQYEDAGFLYENYCGSPTEAISVYITGQLWDQAILAVRRRFLFFFFIKSTQLLFSDGLDMIQCYKHGFANLIEQDLVPAIVESADNIIRELNESMLRFIKYHNRLLIVRANKYLQTKIGTMIIAV